MYPVTIILPVYNGMKYLKQCVSSVLTQSFSQFQFLIIDDCSTDESWDYLQSLQDSRITLYRNSTNKGLFYNLNYLIKKNMSPLIKLWSQDDIMYPACIENIIQFHKDNPAVGYSYTGRDYIDENGNITPVNKIDNTPAIISQELHTTISFITGSLAGNIANVTISAFALDKAGLFNEQMKISGDFDMWVRIAKYFEVGFINKPLIQLRNHKGQLSNQEQYFIYHIKEDIEVYNYLFSYITKPEQKEGRRILRNQKLLFYYTLMLKTLLKGKLKLFITFFKTIASFDNIFIITWYFFLRKVLKLKPNFSLLASLKQY